MPYQRGEDGFHKFTGVEKEKTPEKKFSNLRLRLTTSQNRLPNVGIEQPTGILYYSREHIDAVQAGLLEMEELRQAGLSEFEDLDGKFNTADIIAQVQANVEFSKKIHQLPTQETTPPLTGEEGRDTILKKLLRKE